MKFSQYVHLRETGTYAGQPVPGTGGIQTTGMIAGVPKKLFSGTVNRKFAKEINQKGLGGAVRLQKFNSK